MTTSKACEQARERISQCLDGEPHAAAALERHLRDCSGCRSHAASLEALRPGFAALRDAAPPRELWAGIAARLPAPSAPRRRRAEVGARAAALLLGFAGAGLWVESGTDARAPRHAPRDLFQRLAAAAPERPASGASPLSRVLHLEESR